MKRCAVLVVMLGLGLGITWLGMLSGARPAAAEPAWGVNCLGCHNVLADGVLAVFGHDAVIDPDESATGAPDRGALPAFRVLSGQSAVLQVSVAGLATGDTYAVELRRFNYPGVVAGGTLAYSPDCDWAYWGEPGRYFSDPAVGFTWGSGPDTFAFDIGADAGSVEDTYDLVLAVAGKTAASGELFYAEEHCYLQVVRAEIFADTFESGDTTHWAAAVGAVH